MTTNKSNLPCPVNSHNEWDPLEEVIVGTIDGAMLPEWDTINRHTVPQGEWDKFWRASGGLPYSKESVQAAKQDLAGFVGILESEGVIVRRVDEVSYEGPFATPEWQVTSGFCGANPRDVFLVIGNEIIEAPMADRARYFEARACRTLLKEYFKAGAKWTAAPKPQLLDAQYDLNYQAPIYGEEMRYAVTEFEPTFDAADFVRCGRDIFGQKSHVTNQMGIDWLQRHLGDEYRIHIVKNRDLHAIHIDTTFMPLAPGKVLISPDYIDPETLPSILGSWDVLIAPEPVPYRKQPGIVSNWISINTFMLDEKRIIVEKRQEPLIKALKNWGFQPIPCSFENYYPFLGGFHCATLDIRRKGTLKSYF